MLLGTTVLRYRVRVLPLIRSSVRCVSYVQGQSSSPKTREYFYYIDHQGQLFLDDARLKNFITCFKDKKFLAFFFRRIKKNTTGHYEEEFPYVSPCGPETNYIRCDDLPVVFTNLLDQHGQPIQDIESYGTSSQLGIGEEPNPQPSSIDATSLRTSKSNSVTNRIDSQTDLDGSCSSELMSYGGTGDKLTVPFQPDKLCMLPEGGRVYHAGLEKLEGVGLVKSSLAIELSRFFVYEEEASENSSPVGFRWRGRLWTIDGSTVNKLRQLRMSA